MMNDIDYNNRFISYFIKKNFLSDDECDYIIDKGLNTIESYECTSYNKKKNYNFQFDKCDTIFKKISELIHKVNIKYYNFEIQISNSVELYEYKTNDFFDYHMDFYKGIASRRKLTFLILLSDRDDYTGGDLQFLCNTERMLPRVKGTIAIYPSFVLHRVTKVLSGTRYTLGGECLGNPFK
jgi:predicted 2-oxoglutarate/Fe(II)-dependent dioxygenase YbiX